MATYTVDLPAHNIVAENAVGGYSSPTILGGSEALAETDTATRVVLSQGTTGFFVGSDGGQSGETALGFGLWDKPAGAVVQSIRFVALAYREGGGTVPPGTHSSAYTNQPVETYPVLMLEYNGDGYNGGFSISTLPVDEYGEAFSSVDVKHLIGGNDYVIAGIGTPDTGTFGLCPRVFIDYNYPTPNVAIPVHLAYLAIRITYTLAGPPCAPPLRQHPRSDGLGASSSRRAWPPPRSRQRSLRQGPGSYL